MGQKPSGESRGQGAQQGGQIGKLADVEQLQRDLEALKRDYNRFLTGLERTPPVAAHEALKAALQRQPRAGHSNTRHAFRLGALRASLMSYETLWGRALAQSTDTRTARRSPAKDGVRPAPEDQALPAQQPEGRAAPTASATSTTRPPEVRATPGAGPDAPPLSGTPAAAPDAAPLPDAPAATTSPAGQAMARLHAHFAALAAQTNTTAPSRQELARSVVAAVAAARAKDGSGNVEVTVVLQDGVPVLQVNKRS